MVNFYPIQGIDLRFQVDLVNPKKIQLLEEYRIDLQVAHGNARLFATIFKHRDLGMISDGDKITQVKII